MSPEQYEEIRSDRMDLMLPEYRDLPIECCLKLVDWNADKLIAMRIAKLLELRHPQLCPSHPANE